MSKTQITLDSTIADVINIQNYLSGYDSAISIYGGDYTALWLLSDIHSNKWIIKTSKTIEVTTSENTSKYKYTNSVLWDLTLPDGTSLCDNINKTILNFYQKILFLLIESDAVMPNISASSIHNLAKGIFILIPWSFRSELTLFPKEQILKRLTQKRLESLIADYTHGGAFKTSGFSKLFIQKFNELTGQEMGCYKESFTEEETRMFIHFFKQYDLYKKNNYGLMCIDRTKLLRLFNLCRKTAYDDRFSLFLRQFEPELINHNPDVLLPLNLEYEYPGHTTPLIKEVEKKKTNYKSVNNLIFLISNIIKLRPLFPEYIPPPDSFKFQTLYSYSKNNGTRGGITPWVPLPVCLSTINNAISLILNKGDKIIDCVVELYEVLLSNDLLKNNDTSGKKKELIDSVLNNYTDTLNIKHFYSSPHLALSGRNYVQRLKEDTNLTYLIKLLKAACIITIAALKPIRINEISSLKFDCLYLKENDGFWLMQDIGKSGIDGILPEDAKPIPKIAARAVILLRRLNLHAQQIDPSKKESNYLLYNLNYGYDSSKASIDDKEAIRDFLSIFSDFYELPLDAYGRRWYINIHELRKSFLLTFFWTFKFSSVDACRWLAGHKDPNHIMTYIEANIPGEEMVEVEAEYAYQQLRLFNSDYSLSEIENIESLNDDLCHHFKVKSISEINEGELKDWIQLALLSGEYELYAYGIESQDTQYNAQVAIKIVRN
jgi:hypothetical protein